MKPEERLHRDIAEYLTWVLAGCAWWSTIPLGGGGRLRGAILKGLGVKAGLPDMIIVDAGRALWLEIKPRKEVVSAVQKVCHEALRLARSDVAVVRSVEDAEQALLQWNVPLRARLKGSSAA